MATLLKKPFNYWIKFKSWFAGANRTGFATAVVYRFHRGQLEVLVQEEGQGYSLPSLPAWPGSFSARQDLIEYLVSDFGLKNASFLQVLGHISLYDGLRQSDGEIYLVHAAGSNNSLSGNWSWQEFSKALDEIYPSQTRSFLQLAYYKIRRSQI